LPLILLQKRQYMRDTILYLILLQISFNSSFAFGKIIRHYSVLLKTGYFMNTF
jgi:hypothetical protein